MIKKLLRERNISIYQLAKDCDIPYTTISEIVRGKVRLERCSAETVYKLAKYLDVSMEDLLLRTLEPRVDFEIFKSNVCHTIKNTSEVDFIVNTLQKDVITQYWDKCWYREAFYVLGMIDYLSRLNDIPLCTKYDDIRSRSLKNRIYPRDVKLRFALEKKTEILETALKEAISEFLRFNIVECEVRDAY